jgi:TolA-binding protein
MMCIIQGCPNKAVVRGLCRMHYMRARRTGDATRTRQRGPKPKPFIDPEVSKAEGQVITELRRQLAQAKASVTELRRRLAQAEARIKELQEQNPRR